MLLSHSIHISKLNKYCTLNKYCKRFIFKIFITLGCFYILYCFESSNISWICDLCLINLLVYEAAVRLIFTRCNENSLAESKSKRLKIKISVKRDEMAPINQSIVKFFLCAFQVLISVSRWSMYDSILIWVFIVLIRQHTIG